MRQIKGNFNDLSLSEKARLRKEYSRLQQDPSIERNRNREYDSTQRAHSQERKRCLKAASDRLEKRRKAIFHSPQEQKRRSQQRANRRARYLRQNPRVNLKCPRCLEPFKCKPGFETSLCMRKKCSDAIRQSIADLLAVQYEIVPLHRGKDITKILAHHRTRQVTGSGEHSPSCEEFAKFFLSESGGLPKIVRTPGPIRIDYFKAWRRDLRFVPFESVGGGIPRSRCMLDLCLFMI